MNNEIRDCVDTLIDLICQSRDYCEYQKCVSALDEYPGTLERIMELRKKTIETYNNPDSTDLLACTGELLGECEALQRIPEVNAFFEAEEEMVHVLREVYRRVMDCVRLKTPRTVQMK